jgi:hypothetical protein
MLMVAHHLLRSKQLPLLSYLHSVLSCFTESDGFMIKHDNIFTKGSLPYQHYNRQAHNRSAFGTDPRRFRRERTAWNRNRSAARTNLSYTLTNSSMLIIHTATDLDPRIVQIIRFVFIEHGHLFDSIWCSFAVCSKLLLMQKNSLLCNLL